MPGTAHGAVKMGDLGALDDWIDGFDRMEAGILEHVLREWQTAADVMYSYTQEFAHILTGAMKASSDGPVISVPDRATVEAEITYGPWVDANGHRTHPYALYEVRRGGSHDFIHRAFVAAEDNFGRALPESFKKYVESL